MTVHRLLDGKGNDQAGYLSQDKHVQQTEVDGNAQRNVRSHYGGMK